MRSKKKHTRHILWWWLESCHDYFLLDFSLVCVSSLCFFFILSLSLFPSLSLSLSLSNIIYLWCLLFTWVERNNFTASKSLGQIYSKTFFAYNFGMFNVYIFIYIFFMSSISIWISCVAFLGELLCATLFFSFFFLSMENSCSKVDKTINFLPFSLILPAA